jgi:hypothetical protein
VPFWSAGEETAGKSRKWTNMPVVVNVSVTAADLGRVVDYLGVKGHPNHQFYEIDPPQVAGAKTTCGFVQRTKDGLAFLNQLSGPSNPTKIAARWWVFSFRSGSGLTQDERQSYENRMVDVLGCRALHVRTWHRGLNGAADLNVLDPGIDFVTLPTLRRSRAINLLARARCRSDEWTSSINAARAAAGRPGILTVALCWSERRSSRGEATVEELLIATLTRLKVPTLTLDLLPKVMIAAGFGPKDWEIDLLKRLVIHVIPGRTRKKRRRKARPLRLNLVPFIDVVNALISPDRRGLETSTNGRGDIGAEFNRPGAKCVLPTKWTAPAVIHDDDSAPEIER